MVNFNFIYVNVTPRTFPNITLTSDTYLSQNTFSKENSNFYAKWVKIFEKIKFGNHLKTIFS